MRFNTLLASAAIYLGLIGLGYLLVPATMETGMLGGTPDTVLDDLRAYGGTLIGFALVDWFTRNSQPFKAKGAVFLGNAVGFTLAGVAGVMQLRHGGVQIGWLFLVLNVAFAIAFFVAGRDNSRKTAS